MTVQIPSNNLHLAQTEVVVEGWRMRGGRFLRKQLAACRAAQLQDYRDVKVNVAQTKMYTGWLNRGGIV